MTADMMADMELADENKQNINLHSVIKEEHEEVFDDGCVDNISFINIKVEPFESTETNMNSKTNDEISLGTKQISDNIDCHVVSTYLDDEQQISKFQVKEESEKMRDAVMELDENGEQNKKIYPVKLEDENFENSCENNKNNFIDVEVEPFEATLKKLNSKNDKLINKKKTYIQERNGSPCGESHNKHMVFCTNFEVLKMPDNHFHIKHPNKNGDKLLVDEDALQEQSVGTDVSEKLIFKNETDQTHSPLKDDMLDLVKSANHSTHAGEKLFNCEVCHKSFSRSAELKKHLKNHNIREKPFNCVVCHKLFPQIGQLKEHLRTHTGEKPYSCDVCSKSYSYVGDLKRHIRSHTGEKPFNCEVCYKSFARSGHLKTHLRTHTGEKPFNCEVCQKSFSQSGQLKGHLRTHTGEKPFNCEVCFISFSLIGDLKRHLRSHTGEKPFKCEVCHKSFSRSGHLNTHLRTHTGEKPFNCEVCHKSFSRSGHLNMHLRTHTGEKPFKCEVCHKSFSESGTLKVHLRSHTGEKPFSCEVCHESFTYGSYLKKHLKTHTKEKAKETS